MMPKLELPAGFAHLSILMDELSRSASPNTACDCALTCAQRALQVDRSAALLCDDARVMRFAASRGLSDEYRNTVEGHSPWSLEERSPSAVLVGDVRKAGHLSQYRALFEREHIAALAFLPVACGGTLLGKFMLYYEEPHAFSDDEVALARAIAGNLAFAVAQFRAREQLSQRLSAREDLLAIVSHDLRAPLSIIAIKAAGLVDGLPEFGDGPTTRDADIILRNAVRMERLIRDLLDFSRIEAGELPIATERLHLLEVLHQAFDAAEPLLEMRRFEFHCSMEAAASFVVCDRERLLQIIDNLLGNAIKFTPQDGCITLSVESSGDDLMIGVEDTGAGIAPDDLPHVFDRYWQAGAKRRPGAGLGLYITRALVEAHGGSIWVESIVGQGTKISFSIPRFRDAGP